MRSWNILRQKTASASSLLQKNSPSFSSFSIFQNTNNTNLSTTNFIHHQMRFLSSFGRITDEDRRWWLVHLECAPDVTPGTFVSWLDNCGTHTTKKLIERNIWTIEQVANLSSDQVDELRYKEGCLHMDVVWEHARTVLVPLKARTAGISSEESSLQDRILELRKKREQLREQVEKKRQMLRMRQQNQQQQGGCNSDEHNNNDSPNAENVVDDFGKK
jgi:hypothetical protein